jgi:shikimate kinase
MFPASVTLLGMSGAGKSTVGEILAKSLRYRCIDLDRVIEEAEGKSIQQLAEDLGDDAFLAREAEHVLALHDLGNTVLAPGGSVVYSGKAIEYLKRHSVLIYLEIPFSLLEKRIGGAEHTRGIIGLRTKTLKELYDERRPLYLSSAQYVVDGEGTPEEIAQRVLRTVSPRP